jgi:hypothetical protein
VSVLRVKSDEIDLRIKPIGLAEGPRNSTCLRQQHHLNQSLVKIGRFSTDC